MGRGNRIIFENAIYHVLGRGNRGANIFYDDKDSKFFLKKLSTFSEEYSIQIFSYVLMRNHYHILLRTKKPNLPSFMQRINLIYSKYFNYIHGLNGHLFQDRYKAFVVDKNGYFISVLRYIALNPVVAGIVENAEDYEWSSYRFLFKNEKPEWLRVDMEEAINLAGINREDFKLLVDSTYIDYKDFFKFEAMPPLTVSRIKQIIHKINDEIGNISENQKLLYVAVYYLVNNGAKIKDVSSLLNVSGKTISRIVNRTKNELEKGNILYANILKRVEAVHLVPGTGWTKLE